MTRSPLPRLLLAVSLCTGLAINLLGCDPEVANPDQDPAESLLDIDISENMARFVFDTTPVFDDGMPAYGNDFVTQGYVYPGGFLEDHAGALPDGSPAHPDHVIGHWTCRGVFVGDGVKTSSGPMVITTQVVELFEVPGWKPEKVGTGDTFVSEGYELVDVGVEISRPITGGAGSFLAARGEATQIYLGLNDSLGVNLRQHLELR